MRKTPEFAHAAVKPAFLALPAGLLPAGVIFEVVYLLTGRPVWAQTALWMIAAGIGCALVAAVFGFVDSFSLPAGSHTKRTCIAHSAIDLGIAVVFAVSLLLRRSDAALAAPTSAMLLSLFGIALHLVNVHLGGELLREMGIGFSPVRARITSSALERAGTHDARSRS
jgi:uncharacterized membrane protein